MTTAASDNPRAYELGDFNEFAVVADDIIYEGSAVGLESSGKLARPLTTSDVFVGFAQSNCNNAGGAASAKRVQVRDKGLISLPVTSVADNGDVGKPVYASDDNAFTLTAGSNVFIGRVHRVDSAGVALVAFDATRGSIGSGATLTAATGTGSTTIADVGGSFSQTTLNNNFKSLADAVNAINKKLA